MKKTLAIILITAAVIVGAVFAYIKFDVHIPFIDNYAQNFSDNLFNIRLQYEMKKLEREEAKNQENSETTDDENLLKNSDTENTQTQQPTPDDKSEENVEENIAVPGKNDIAIKDSIKVVKTQKKNENGESVEILTKKLVNTCDPIAFPKASNSQFAKFRSGILCASENKMVLFEKNGKEKFTYNTSISNPIMKTNEPYILLWEQNSDKANIYENNKLLYTITTSDKILNGYISAVGDCVLVTAKPYYKGEVKVYNKSGEEVFSRSFGRENVVAAAISDSRKLAVSLLSAESGANSKVAFFDINKTEEASNIIYKNTIIYDLEFSGNSLIAYADDKMISIKSNSKEDWVYPYNDKTPTKCQRDKKDIRLLIFDNLNNGELAAVSLTGKEVQRLSTDIIPNYGDICDGYVIYNDERNLYFSRLDGTLLAIYSASRDIQKAYFINSDNILIVYNSSLEFLHVEKGE